jgi:hypothetical protein
VRAAVHADPQPVNQFPSQPSGNYRQHDAGEPCDNRAGRRFRGDVAAEHPAQDEEAQHDRVSESMPEPDALGTGTGRDAQPVEPSEQR